MIWFAVVGSGAAILTLLVVKLWPQDDDTLERGSATFLRRVRRVLGGL